ncbi:MAG: IS66 family insertion sequence element accessory protein TnpA [Planctomycetota bacterium]
MPKRRGPRPSAAKERYWRAMVRRQARSGLGVRELCRAQAIGEAPIFAWRRELRRRNAPLPHVAVKPREPMARPSDRPGAQLRD